MSVRALHEALGGSNDEFLTSTRTTSVATASGTVAIVATAPQKLADQAGLPLEVYSLARCIASEGYSSKANPIGRAAAAVVIGQAIRNGAGKRSITAKLTASVHPAAAGFYGEQSGRYAATTRDPRRWHGLVAQAVLAGDVPDLAQGATMFLAPSVWAGSGTQAGRKLEAFDKVMRRWHSVNWDEAKEGKGYSQAMVNPVPTVDPGHLLVFRKTSSASLREASYKAALRHFEDVAAGRSGPAPGDPDASRGALVALLGLGALGAMFA